MILQYNEKLIHILYLWGKEKLNSDMRYTNTNRNCRTGFTLIELLIVVAIIGILAAIAVPNFLNAQTRAKMSRCLADMKAVSTAAQLFGTDRNKMLVDIRDDDTTIGTDRIQNDFNGIGWNGGSGNRNNLAVLSPLTSPVSYMGSIPRSPFVPAHMLTSNSGNNEGFGRIGNDAYAYWDNDPEIQEPSGNNHQDWNLGFLGRYVPRLRPWDFIVISFGPAADSGTTLNYGLPYHPSNGLHSNGEVFITSYGLTNENANDSGSN